MAENIQPVSIEAIKKLEGQHATLTMNGSSLLFILGALQLAFRHPGYQQLVTAEIVRGIAHELQGILVKMSPDLEKVCEAGWDVRWDV